jgi:hypothetical protein
MSKRCSCPIPNDGKFPRRAPSSDRQGNKGTTYRQSIDWLCGGASPGDTQGLEEGGACRKIYGSILLWFLADPQPVGVRQLQQFKLIL